MRARVAHAADVAKQPPELKQVALLALHMRHAGRYSSDKNGSSSSKNATAAKKASKEKLLAAIILPQIQFCDERAC